MAALNEQSETTVHGERLREAREGMNLSLADAAARLHLSPRVLEDLEHDRLSSGVELPFMRGYLKNYAKLVGLPADELARAFDGRHRERAAAHRVKPIVTVKHEPLESSSSWGYLVGAGLLAVLGGAYLWWQSTQAVPVRSPQSTPAVAMTMAAEPSAAEPEAVLADSGVAPASADPVTPTEQTPEPSQDLPISTTESTTPAPEPVATPAAAESVAQLTPATAEPAPTVPGVQAGLALKFTGDCWIKVEDATGTVLSRGLKRAGHDLKLAGAPPFKLILGNPGAVSMRFKGESVDLSGYPANQVAKLQLGASG